MTQEEFDTNLQKYLETYGYRLFSKALKQSIQPIIDALNESESVAFTNSIAGMLYTGVPIATAMQTFYNTAWNKQSRGYVKWLKANLPPEATIGVGFENPIMDAALKDYFNTIGGQHIKDINDTSLRKIQSAFQTALDNNEGFRGAEKRLIKEVGMTKTRARLIARTESVMVTNAAKFTQSEIMPILMEKTWIHDHPKNPRSWHVRLDRTTIDLDKKFNMINGIKMKHPGDPAGGVENNANCKCTMLTKAKLDKENNIIYK
jgi:hypothetical protein